MNFRSFLSHQLKQNNALTLLLLVNSIIYIGLTLTTLIFQLFNVNLSAWIASSLCLSASIPEFLSKPWTVLTYMFVHTGFFHLFFNMLCLYWFGKLFQESFVRKQLTGVYLLGGLVGGGLYMAAFNIFPYLSEHLAGSSLLGASAAVMAIITAAAVTNPNRQLRLLFIGAIKIKYVAIAAVIISMLSITSSNAGGQIAHLGGAAAGWLYAVLLQKHIDILRPITFIGDKLSVIFVLRKRKSTPKTTYHYVKSDADFNQQKARNDAEMDIILDKIRKSGYGSLSDKEKKKLFDHSANL
ncbi:MAG: rhomboid family intramembrane serine protease [Prevotellaceae bacterium]|jgi:membrane associated rhomboid family serine protease|nr:rhomboid family intramembrane serine protease [Prevotellaceae bacterium]